MLKDEDLTMVRRSEVGFKCINTLSHYRVIDGAVMSLIPRQTSTSCYDLSTATDRSSFQHRYGRHTNTAATINTTQLLFTRNMPDDKLSINQSINQFYLQSMT